MTEADLQPIRERHKAAVILATRPDDPVMTDWYARDVGLLLAEIDGTEPLPDCENDARAIASPPNPLQLGLPALSPTRMLAPLRDAVLHFCSTEHEAAAMLYVRGAVQAARQRLKEIGELLDEQLLTWMEVNNRNIPLDDGSYLYPGKEKKVKCRDVGATLAALEEAAAGEVERVVGCLSAGAMKPGACRQLLGERWGEFFEETVEREVATGKPRRVVAESNPFTRKLGRQHG